MYLELDRDANHDPTEAYKRSLEACGKARTADADSAAAWHHLSFAEWQWGQYTLGRGGSPVEALQRAIAASAEAQRRRPDWAEAHNYMGIAYGYLGRGAMARGEDPRPLVRQAIASFDRALELAPGFAYAHTTRGIGYYDLGRDAVRRGEDPSALFDTAAASYRRALALNPGWILPRASLAETLVARGAWEAKVGRPCAGTLDAAIAEAEPLLARDDTASGHQLLGAAFRARADCAAGTEQSPRGFVERALGEYRRALQRAPRERDLELEVRVLEGRLASSQGSDRR
jgi:tetratricopeptide (TPR) repeat protein